MITTNIFESISRKIVSKKQIIAAKIRELRRADGLPETQDLPKKIESHPVFTEEVFRVLLKRKSEDKK